MEFLALDVGMKGVTVVMFLLSDVILRETAWSWIRTRSGTITRRFKELDKG